MITNDVNGEFRDKGEIGLRNITLQSFSRNDTLTRFTQDRAVALGYTIPTIRAYSEPTSNRPILMLYIQKRAA